MKDPIIKSKQYPTNHFNSCLTDEFRNLAAKSLKGLDTPNSFMYLYRRFGEPNSNNKDEYKILYSYWLKYKSLRINVSASYHQHVYFSLFVPDKIFDAWKDEKKEFFKNLYNKYKHKGLVYMPYLSIYPEPFWGLTDEENKKNWELSESNYEPSPEEGSLYNYLLKTMNDYRAMLSKKEIDFIKKHQPELSEFPEIKLQCEDFLAELKKGFWIRDVPINILGYESKRNPILLEEEYD